MPGLQLEPLAEDEEVTYLEQPDCGCSTERERRTAANSRPTPGSD